MDNLKKETKLALEIASILYSAIKEAGNQGIPSGHLYAAVQNTISLDLYQTTIGVLKKHGFIEESFHLLKVKEATHV